MLLREDIRKKFLKLAKELGRTPGAEVFYEYAEIGIHDLKKCGYPNYGELVRDVGLPPNKFDKTKYNPDQLRKLFIKVIREEKRWPTRGLLDIRHFKNIKSFPESATFYKRLGKVKDLAQDILNFIEDKQGYDDIARICNSTLAEFENDIEEATRADKGGVGYVYLLKSSLNNAVVYKIGKTKNLEQRLKQLRQPSNVEEPIHLIKTDDIDGVEQYWLNRFSNKRLYPNKPKDEWFKLNSSDIRTFKRWKRIF